MSLPAIPKDWSPERIQRELERARQYEQRFRSQQEGRSADHYADLAKQLQDELARRQKVAA